MDLLTSDTCVVLSLNTVTSHVYRVFVMSQAGSDFDQPAGVSFGFTLVGLSGAAMEDDCSL